jgi:fluoride ion exporter CrcB/FEX
MPLASCPHCGKNISDRAKQCKHCMQFVSIVQRAESVSPSQCDSARHDLSRSSTDRPISDSYARGSENQISVAPAPAPADSVGSPLPQATSLSVRAMKRYQDAYAVAKAMNAQGQNIKALALVAAAIIGVATLALALSVVAAKAPNATAPVVFIVGAIGAVTVWSIIFSYGVRVAAAGQQLLASLDVAVHTSPFMTDAERVQAMAL